MIRKAITNVRPTAYVGVLLAAALVLSSICGVTVSAIEVPKGIDGHVYALDGITPVPDITYLFIIDATTNETIAMHPGLGEPGRYSISLDWNSDDNITVKAANPSHESERNISLTGIIHDFDIYLNTTLRNIAPNITSNPETYTLRGENYTYQIIAYDWNYDVLTYSLLDAPTGMTIDHDGLVKWLPEDATGTFDVVVNVSDGINSTLQTYQLFVEDVNVAPVLVVKQYDMTSGRAQLVAYDQNNDYIRFSLLSGPPGFTILTNGTMLFSDLTAGIVPIQVGLTDGFIVVSDIITIRKYGTGTLSGGGGGGSAGGNGGSGGGHTDVQKKNATDNPPSQVRFANRAPTGTPPLDSVVFSYAIISDTNTTAEYVLDATSLKDNHASPSDVVVYQYDNGWMKIPSSVTGMTVRFTATMGVYAIALCSQPVEKTPALLHIPEPTIITGRIVKSDGTPYGRATVKVFYGDKELGATTATGPYNSTFQMTINDIRGKTISVVASDGAFSGTVTITASSSNDVLLIMKKIVETTNIVAAIAVLLLASAGVAALMRYRIKTGRWHK